jgi:hypothetical protein
MRRALLLAALLLATTCFADSFHLLGILKSPSGPNVGTFAGTIEINTMTGSIVRWDVPMPAILPGSGLAGLDAFTFTPSTSEVGFNGGWYFRDVTQTHELFFDLPNNAFIGFRGSAFSGDYGDIRSPNGAVYSTEGTIAPVPEPSSLLLLGSGLLGILALRRKFVPR